MNRRYQGLAVLLLCLSACADSRITERLQTLTGNEFLAMSSAEQAGIVEDALARFTTWRFWDRPDICASVLNPESLSELFESSAQAAQDNPLMFSLAVISHEECLAREEVFK